MRRALAVFTAFAAILWAALPLRFDVRGPRLGIPALLAPGEVFTTDLHLSHPGWRPALEARLERDGVSYPLELVGDHLAWNRLELDYRTPPDAPHGGYDLVLVDDSGVEHRRERSVHLLPPPAHDLRIVQLADLPTFGSGPPDGFGEGPGDAEMRQIVREINLIRPDYVLLSGDVAYVGGWFHYHKLHEHLLDLESPVICVLGNHEYKGLAGYLETMGAPRHVVDHGDLSFVSLNTGHGRDQLTASQFTWLERVMDERHDQRVIVQMHHPLFWKRKVFVRVDEMVELFADHEVPIVLSGHWHADNVFDEHGVSRTDGPDFPGTKYVTTTAAGAELHPDQSTAFESYHGYRVFELHGNQLGRYTYDGDGDGQPDTSSSHPAHRMLIEDLGDGGVRIASSWNEDLLGATVSLRSRRELVPDKGTLLRRRVQGDMILHEVRIDVPAGADFVVKLVEPRP
ncbi:MAG: metallophosphoesterase [Planctomycetes bacterium]|nr:metallophosphoesterase [Planctomycetota bacterium]MCB9904509.1 metallophosphoesterase [Planctomycetota bacterium]